MRQPNWRSPIHQGFVITQSQIKTDISRSVLIQKSVLERLNLLDKAFKKTLNYQFFNESINEILCLSVHSGHPELVPVLEEIIFRPQLSNIILTKLKSIVETVKHYLNIQTETNRTNSKVKDNNIYNSNLTVDTMVSENFDLSRLRDLENHIIQEQDLLQEYEQVLRNEDDPRRIKKYRGEIERQQQSITRYQKEFEELKQKLTGSGSAQSQIQKVDNQLEVYRQKSADMMEIIKLLASKPINVEVKAVAQSESKGDTYNQSGNFGIGHMSGGTIEKGAKVAGVIKEAQQKNLAEVAAEIQDLLNYFEQNNPTIIEAQQIVKSSTERQPELQDATVIEAAIKTNSTLKQRLKAAGEAAYVETVKMLLPPVGVAIEAVKAWQNPE